MRNLDDKNKTRRRCGAIERSSEFSQVYKIQYFDLLGSMQCLPQCFVHTQISLVLHILSFSHVELVQKDLKTFGASLGGQLLTRPSCDLSRL